MRQAGSFKGHANIKGSWGYSLRLFQSQGQHAR